VRKSDYVVAKLACCGPYDVAYLIKGGRKPQISRASAMTPVGPDVCVVDIKASA